MSLIESNYPESRFGGFSNCDGTIAFYVRVQSLLQPDMIVLDVGCGRGAEFNDDKIPYRAQLRLLKGRCRKVIGIDVDPIGQLNPGLDEFRLLDSDAWPVEDSTVDLIISDFVLEHIENRNGYFSEVQRVLKPGGIFCARTANKIGYVGLLARLIPNRRHAKILGQVQLTRKELDVFPTKYQVNTVWTIRRMLKKYGLDGVVYGYEAEPSYLQFSSLLYRVGKYIHMLTPPAFRTCLFVFARKLES